MTQFAIASISDIELDFIYDSVARERAAIEDEMMLRDSAEALVAEGIERIVVLPMFIAQGGHLKRDVPLLLDELRVRHPLIRFEQAAALGDADAMVQAMAAHVLALANE